MSENDQRPYRIVETPSFLYEDSKTYVFTWNPAEKVPIETFANWRSQILDKRFPLDQWTCYSVNKVRAGDRFIMLRTGDAPRGMVGWGWIRSNGRTEDGGHVDILWEYVLDPNEPLDIQSIEGAESFCAPRRGGVELDAKFHDIIWQAWDQRREDEPAQFDKAADESDSTPSLSAQPPTSVSPALELTEDTASSLEGRLIPTWSTRRERDAKNRARCLEVHEPRCLVCKMSFLEEYGEIGRDFIHVHHERPLASSDADNGTVHVPACDMKPVCPNCHVMLHRGMNAQKGEVRSIAELRALRGQAKAAS